MSLALKSSLLPSAGLTALAALAVAATIGAGADPSGEREVVLTPTTVDDTGVVVIDHPVRPQTADMVKADTRPAVSGSATDDQGAQAAKNAGDQDPGNGKADDDDDDVANRHSFEVKLWNYLNRAKFRNWAPSQGRTDEAFEGPEGHGQFVKIYLNRKLAGNQDSVPFEAIAVMEDYVLDRASLHSISVMYRVSGYNTDAGDWYWVRYRPNGRVLKTKVDDRPLAGKVSSCIQCHSEAEDDDFVFFNDAVETP